MTEAWDMMISTLARIEAKVDQINGRISTLERKEERRSEREALHEKSSVRLNNLGIACMGGAGVGAITLVLRVTGVA